ncbi:Ent-kaur-16-ene synthase, chloroplastic [Linum grandiflorum]
MALINAISQPARPVNLSAAAKADVRHPKIPAGRNSLLNLQHGGLEEKRVKKMKELLRKEMEISASPYDTAWVSMVGCGSTKTEQLVARFPQSLRWVMENQHPDGSWASNPTDPVLVKDSLSSTLASVIALRKWGIGDQLIQRGLDFIGANAWASNDKNQRTPIGFDVTFAGMMESATAMGLNLPIDPSSFHQMLRRRDQLVQTELGLGEVAYAAEGLTMTKFSGGTWKWEEMVRKHQRKNGSLFNSPSTTAAALLHLHNDKSLAYLDSILATYNHAPAVPTVYPLDILSRLEMVDNLVNLGIHQYFTLDITFILDDIYKYWIQRDEDLFSDIGCLAKAFRLLRLNGYHVSSDVFEGLDRQEDYLKSVNTPYKSTETVLELYKASLNTILPSEPILDRIKNWTTRYLRQITTSSLHDSAEDWKVIQEVEYALKYPYASLERIENRHSIEIADVDNNNAQLLKTSYRCSNTEDHKEWVEFAVEDYNRCQSVQRIELELLEQWVKDYRIEELKFARQKVVYGFFAAAAILFLPEHADARSSWAKNTVLVTLVDDLFDVGGSEEELLNFIELVKAWDGHKSVGFCSEQVEIVFKAVYDTTNEYVAKASHVQGRCVKDHFMEMWLVLVDCMWAEYVRGRDKIVPTMEEYIATGYVSVALGPVILVPMYFLGCKLSEEAIKSKEYDDLFMHVSVVARLLNDLATIGREMEQGKENGLALVMMQENGKMREEEARRTIQGIIEKHRKELLRMVVLKEGEEESSIVGRGVKEVFWQTSKIVHMFYMSKDGFSSPHEMMAAIDSVIYKPILLPHQQVYSGSFL